MAKLPLSLALALACLLFAFSYASAGSDSDPTGLELPAEKTASFFITVESEEIEQPPLKMISFRPVDRRFKRRPFPMAFRHGRDIPYGDDMILSSKDRSDEPTRWTKFRHAEEDEWQPRHHHRLHHPHHHHREHDHDEHHHDHDHHDHDHDEHDHGHHGHGFMRSFSKFLGHF